MIVIGKNPILETLKKSPKDFNKLIFLKTVKPEPRLKEIVILAEQHGINKVFLNKFDFEKYFNSKNKKEGISQGVIG
ncbi:MAG: hypothetical protein LWX07_09485, partial [Bacteroidetes bacterium]|nr:hypothetical protein [Bacteroidota bacterium]